MRRTLALLVMMLLLAGCAGGSGRPSAVGNGGSEPPPKTETPPKTEPVASTGPLTVTGTLLAGEFLEESRLVRAGRSVVRFEFSHPVDVQSLGRIRDEGRLPVERAWEPGNRALRYTLELKHGEWTAITLEGVRAEGGGTFATLHYSLRGVGKASLWRLEPGGEPTRITVMDDRFESLYVSPGGEALALYEVAEEGYMDFYRVWMGDPATGSLRQADVPVRDLQAASEPRWWRGGALLAGISWGVHKVDGQGQKAGGIPAMETGQGLAVRGTGVAPDGTPAILVSPFPGRESQPPADLLVGERRLTGVTKLPLWPKNRGDTHYWPHVQIHWISPAEVILLDLDTHFTQVNEWRRVTLSTGESKPFPRLTGWARAYPDPMVRRFIVWVQEKGWHLLAEDGSAIWLNLPETAELGRVQPVWSGDGKRVFMGAFDITAETGAVERLKAVPAGLLRVARDSAGRVWWLRPEGQ